MYDFDHDVYDKELYFDACSTADKNVLVGYRKSICLLLDVNVNNEMAYV